MRWSGHHQVKNLIHSPTALHTLGPIADDEEANISDPLDMTRTLVSCTHSIDDRCYQIRRYAAPGNQQQQFSDERWHAAIRGMGRAVHTRAAGNAWSPGMLGSLSLYVERLV